MTKFGKLFTQQESIPEEGIEQAIAVMRSGRLHRYNAVGDECTETELLEQEFAAYSGSKYCLACASGGYALHIAMRAVGVKTGDKVLCNAFTLAPVPGAIDNAGGIPVFVETTENFTIDLLDLEAKAAAGDVHYLLLSHMRGHIVDMDRLMQICERYNICVIEDCAHTMGATWKGRKSGTFGAVGCFSTQTYKHINSGEGGLLITNDQALMAKATIYSGSYMLFDRHVAGPKQEAYEYTKFNTPNYSGRMDNLRAAILRPQLRNLDRQCERWNELYRVTEECLLGIEGVRIPARPVNEYFVGSSIQFSLPGLSKHAFSCFIQSCEDQGVSIKWFGDPDPKGYTSRFDSWRYLEDMSPLPKTETVLETMCDMRLPLTFDVEDCRIIAVVISEVLEALDTSSN